MHANAAGFDEDTGTLNVFASPETQALAVTADLSTALTDAVNGAIAQNWQGIKNFTGATGDATTVTVTTAGATYAAAVAALVSGVGAAGDRCGHGESCSRTQRYRCRLDDYRQGKRYGNGRHPDCPEA